jgi:hypothetical protein
MKRAFCRNLSEAPRRGPKDLDFQILAIPAILAIRLFHIGTQLS